MNSAVAQKSRNPQDPNLHGSDLDIKSVKIFTLHAFTHKMGHIRVFLRIMSRVTS